ncbi:hypothetical protein FS749_009219 [Ceratobasidium sp. UAMH 11750]|nr:hypothetical protein FS749_009219 [Ceratobasidium sp. UAMH 11750]
MDYARAFVARRILFPNTLNIRQIALKRRLTIVLLLTVIRYRRFLYPTRRNRRAGYLRRQELMPNPRLESGWLALYRSREDRAYITTMSIDVATFDYILRAGFEAAWNTRPIRRNDTNPRGRPRMGRRSLDAPGALGLLLHYLRSTANGTSLEMIFAIIPTTLSRYIQAGLPILFQVLQRIPEAVIKWPTPDQMELYSAYINARHPKIDGAFGFIDGLHVPVGASGDLLAENAMWSRWLHSHSISNIIVFAPDVHTGTIINARINAPGSWHDAKTSRPVYDKLREETPDKYFLIADSAFPTVNQGGHEKVHVPLTARSNLRGMTREEKLAALDYSAAITSARQAVEWGMRAIQGSFSRLRLPLDANDGEWRSVVMECCLRLHNVRARLVGINQIRTVYIPVWTGGQEDFFEELHRAIFPKSNRTRQGTAYLVLEDD